MDPPQFRSMFFEVHRKVVKILKTIIESAGQGRFENRKMIRISGKHLILKFEASYMKFII